MDNAPALTGMGGGMPDMGSPTPQPVQQAAPPQAPVAAPPQADPAQVADVQHHALLGKAFKNLMGMNTNYTVDPASGQVVADQTPNKPGQFFKAVLAASLLGGEAGANGNPAQGFMGGLVRGAGASMAQANQQDALKRQQAQQQYADQMKAQENQRAQNRDQREATSAASEETLRKAQISQANAETYRTNVLTQGSSLTQHKEVADIGKQHFKDYDEADLKPVFSDVPESEMQDKIKNRPGAASFDWEATGVKEGKDADGKPTYEYTYSAYDPKGMVPVSESTLAQWKKDGMDKNFPEIFQTVKPGMAIDATQYVALKKMDAKLYNENLIRTKNQEAQDKAAADLKHVDAETEASKASAAHSYAETGKVKEETKQLKDKSDSNAEGSGPEQIADAIHQGRGSLEQLTQGMGKEAAAFRREVEGIFLKKYQEPLESYKAYAKMAETPAVQAQLSNARSIFGANGEPGSFDVLEDAMRKVPKAPFPVLSKLGQKTAYNLGSKEMAEVMALKTDLSTEIAKFNTAAGGATSDTQIEHYRQQLNEAQTPEQVEAVLKDVRRISSKRLGGIIGPNPYLHNMSADINDPLTKKPRGETTPRPNATNGLQSLQVNPATKQQIGWDGQQWVDAATRKPVQ